MIIIKEGSGFIVDDGSKEGQILHFVQIDSGVYKLFDAAQPTNRFFDQEYYYQQPFDPSAWCEEHGLTFLSEFSYNVT